MFDFFEPFGSFTFSIVWIGLAFIIYQKLKDKTKHAIWIAIASYFFSWITIGAIVYLVASKKKDQTLDDRIDEILEMVRQKANSSDTHEKGDIKEAPKVIESLSEVIFDNESQTEDEGYYDASDSHNQGNSTESNSDKLQRCSDILGVPLDADMEMIQSVYESAIKKHDTSQMKRDGMPDEYIEFSKKRKKEIDEAYRYLRRNKR